MSQSLSRILLHIIFSTKNRLEFLKNTDMRNRMHGYLASIFNENNSPAIEVGGTEDHVHILCLLSRTHAVSELINKAKSNSSAWAKTFGGMCTKFSWQAGYGVFSVNQSEIESVRRYIQNQGEHHRHKSFQEEYLEFLRAHAVAYDERYLWE
jgi:putative transposase